MAELLNGSGSLDVTDSSNTTRFPEGMAPSAVNNGVRALEGMLARYLKDSNGSVAVAGTDTYTATINADTGFALYDGFIFAGDFANANTGAATINLTPDGGSALGAIDIKKNSTAALVAGDIAAGQKCILIYDGSTSDFQLVNPVVTTDVVNDTSPQLGGDLDLNGNNIDFPTTANVSDCLDEDNMASNSATSLATQQSIKAYVDASVVPQANQAAIEAETDENTYVPPDLLKHHPGIAKGWAVVDGDAGGGASLLASHNVTSVTDNGAGDYTITWDTDFSSADYMVTINVFDSGGVLATQYQRVISQTAGAVRIECRETSGGTLTDVDKLYVAAFGDQ